MQIDERSLRMAALSDLDDAEAEALAWSEVVEPTWSLGTAALHGAARWSDVFLPEPLWAHYADLAAGATSPSEIYIALAIEAGVEGASDALEADYFPIVDRLLLREAGADAEEIADVKAALREQLFATGDGLADLVHWASHGQLAALIREAAVDALDEARANAPTFTRLPAAPAAA